LVALPKNLASESDRNFWSELSTKLPEIPLRETPSGIALAPAERFEDKQNFENPELYAVFPFRLFGVGNPNIEWGKMPWSIVGTKGILAGDKMIFLWHTWV
ncbi:MAG: hypothetical protein DRJ10_12615, partial [Bacteroidetes bacterium]